MKIVCVVPTYNCATEISSTLNSALEISSLIDEIWVIDNGSKDNTLNEVIRFRKINSKQNVRIFQNLSNINLGGTHKVAFRMAISGAFTHLIILHGDNQASPLDLLPVLKTIENQDFEISYFGSRFSRQSRTIGYSIARKAGNMVLNTIFSVFTHKLLTDLGSGLNLYNLEQIKKLDVDILTDEMSFNYELLLKFVGHDLTFKYFPISWSEHSQVSNARNSRVFIEGLMALVRWRLRLCRQSQVIVCHKLPSELLP